jgi:hypothetical protein
MEQYLSSGGGGGTRYHTCTRNTTCFARAVVIHSGQNSPLSWYTWIQVIYFHSVSQAFVLTLCSKSDIAPPSFSAQEIVGKDISLQFRISIYPHT